MDPVLYARVVRCLQHAVRTARAAEDQAEAQAVLDALTGAPAPTAGDPTPDPAANPHALADAVQAENAAAEQAAYARANVQTEG